ncbi:palmitoyl-protein thioesterase 1-like protein, partial [Tanacetum coccineum]
VMEIADFDLCVVALGSLKSVASISCWVTVTLSILHHHPQEGRKSKSEKDDDAIVNNVDDDVPSLIFLSSFHRIGDQCSNKGMTQFTQQLSNLSNSQGFCIEIGDGAWDSWFMPLLQQTEAVCDQVKNMHQLANGYNIVGLSQGNLIGRGVVEFCDGGPQAIWHLLQDSRCTYQVRDL